MCRLITVHAAITAPACLFCSPLLPLYRIAFFKFQPGRISEPINHISWPQESIRFSIICFRALPGNHTKGFINIMNIIKKTAITSLIAISLGASSIAFAEEAAAPAAVAAPASSLSETIRLIEAALVEVSKSDFAAAQLHLKTARETSDKITGNEKIVKQGYASTVQGQILAKKGEVENATAELNKALGFYKSIKQ
jgi:hypothetical protein